VNEEALGHWGGCRAKSKQKLTTLFADWGEIGFERYALSAPDEVI